MTDFATRLTEALGQKNISDRLSALAALGIGNDFAFAHRLLALVEAAPAPRLRGFIRGHSFPLDWMPEINAIERELAAQDAALEALNG